MGVIWWDCLQTLVWKFVNACRLNVGKLKPQWRGFLVKYSCSLSNRWLSLTRCLAACVTISPRYCPWSRDHRMLVTMWSGPAPWGSSWHTTPWAHLCRPQVIKNSDILNPVYPSTRTTQHDHPAIEEHLSRKIKNRFALALLFSSIFYQCSMFISD